MRIVSWNVNGIRAVERKGMFSPLLLGTEPDIFCLQETKATVDQSPVSMPGYTEFWNSALKKGYSGTAIFTRRAPVSVTDDFPLKLAAKHHLVPDSFGDLNREGRLQTADFGDFYLVNVYTPNTKPDLARLAIRSASWDPAFLEHVRTLDSQKPVVVCGDLNVAHTADDLANPKANDGKQGFTAQEREGMTRLIDAGFHDTFRQFETGTGHYTWWSAMADARSRNVGWRIDYVLVSSRLTSSVTSAPIHGSYMGSDHCPVGIDVEI
jgi:exodeoxyribonuclease-3